MSFCNNDNLPVSVSRENKVRLSDSWLEAIKNFSLGSRTKSLGQSPSVGVFSIKDNFPVSVSTLKTAILLCPRFPEYTNLPSEET